ncbi:MAG: YciI family protein [Balneolaceae bacterium]
MKRFLLMLGLLAIATSSFAQDSTSIQQPETFEYEWEGEMFTMQKYFIVFLKSGPTRSQSEEEAAELQNAHLAYLGGLYVEGIINLNGPTDGTGDIRGFSVYNVPTIEKAIELASNDPMVKAGRLVIEAHPWWLAKGSGVK